jgi:8-oxo-dGTP pyrophosphatase MutT (NUDIX family)|tara:strand:- start:449 stop:874 length:426 start_codon:yes stop_codon:yes gene_type:complete
VIEVALAMLERDGRWLLQLRDDIDGIVHPGTWALFGGHLDPGETAEQALVRELKEEINWDSPPLPAWFVHRNSHRIAHFFRGTLTSPLERLDLLEGQDMVLAPLEEIRSGQVWSPRRQTLRNLSPSLQRAVQELELEQGLH